MHHRRYMKRKTALLSFFTNGPYSSEHKYWANFRVIVTGTPAAAAQAAAAPAPPQLPRVFVIPLKRPDPSGDRAGTPGVPEVPQERQRCSTHSGVYYDPYLYYYNPYFYGAGGYSPYCDDALAGQCYCPDDGGFGAGLAGVYCPAVDCQFIDCMSPDGLGDVVGAGGADVMSGYEAAFGDLSSFMEESGGACGGWGGGGGDGGGGDGGGGGCGGD
jgi:hypothetical protein